MRYIAFLRGINVSGQKLIKMADLKQHLVQLGYANVVTYIQSGNILFDDNGTDPKVLSSKMEAELATFLGYSVVVIIRSIEEIKNVICNIPLKLNTTGTTEKVYVTFLADIPATDYTTLLSGYANEQEQIIHLNREVYIGTVAYGNSKLSNTLIENKLKMSATTRNWATVNKVILL